MEKTYDEQTAINALVGVLIDVVKAGKENPAFEEDCEFVDISDGSRHQPLILLYKDDVENLIPFLEEQMAEESVIEYFRKLDKTGKEQQG